MNNKKQEYDEAYFASQGMYTAKRTEDNLFDNDLKDLAKEANEELEENNETIACQIQELENMLDIFANGIYSKVPETNETFRMLLFINNLNILFSVATPIIVNTNDNIPPILKKRLLFQNQVALDNLAKLLKLIEPNKETVPQNMLSSLAELISCFDKVGPPTK